MSEILGEYQLYRLAEALSKTGDNFYKDLDVFIISMTIRYCYYCESGIKNRRGSLYGMAAEILGRWAISIFRNNYMRRFIMPNVSVMENQLKEMARK